MKISCNSMKINGIQWKTFKFNENQWKSWISRFSLFQMAPEYRYNIIRAQTQIKIKITKIHFLKRSQNTRFRGVNVPPSIPRHLLRMFGAVNFRKSRKSWKSSKSMEIHATSMRINEINENLDFSLKINEKYRKN